jgi:hypothetical protein
MKLDPSTLPLINAACAHVQARAISGRQASPGQHSLLQGGAISRDARAIVQGRWSASIGVDFVIVAHQRTQFFYGLRGPSVARAALVERHARDRGNCRRLIDPTARVASLARHADFDAIARVLALPRAIGMLFTDPAGVVAN